MKRNICILLIITMLLTLFTGCESRKDESRDPLHEFLSALAEDDLQGMTLTVYYMDSDLLTYAPMQVEWLIDYCEKSADNEDSPYHKIVVDSSSLQEHKNLLLQLDPQELLTRKDSIYTDARICFQFKKEETEQMWHLVYYALEEDRSNLYALFNETPMIITDCHRKIQEAFLPEEY